MLKCVMLSLVLSADAFGVGLALGSADIKISKSSKAVLSVFSFVIAFFAVAAGSFILSFLPYKAVSSVSSLLLIIPGLLIIKQSLLYRSDKKYKIGFLNILNSPEKCDNDCSKQIDCKEAVMLSAALSADNICAIASFGFNSKSIILIPVFMAVFQLSLLSCGINTGKKIKNIQSESREKWIFISGLLLVMLGISNLF